MTARERYEAEKATLDRLELIANRPTFGQAWERAGQALIVLFWAMVQTLAPNFRVKNPS